MKGLTASTKELMNDSKKSTYVAEMLSTELWHSNPQILALLKAWSQESCTSGAQAWKASLLQVSNRIVHWQMTCR